MQGEGNVSTVTFSGSVSAQAVPGETVTITVTKPDGTETLTATTQADGTFSTTKEYTVPGNYTAVFHIDADAIYLAADAGPIPFVIPLQPRTLTVSVTVA